ncbi:MAG: TetM/TetW/TetO/TetS family tetracycline resistance ribosomal protection protein [Acetatifactor sp.]|nr:TetM/TetW/TetO/TetS family tetracycline resistance ribosomal protection protein [Acetatifactor sp.]
MQPNDRLVIGILAHVDAGKTTLAEGLLYTCGKIRSLGRVDHGDAFLDNFSLERDRGITIFSKQAELAWKDLDITLLDTPGHVDFCAEMERTLQVLDAAVLVINGADGVQGHSETLWKLLRRYEIPAFLFVNKMDQEGTDKDKLLKELQMRLDEHCVEFAEELDASLLESIALCQESLMEEYLENGKLDGESIVAAIADRQIFPCYFGSALKLWGVETLLNGIRKFAPIPTYEEKFGARVFKIARDESGNRLTYLKVTGGSLCVKQIVSNAGSAGQEGDVWEEKADQLRVYNGAKYQAVDEVPAGGVCAVLGLKSTFAGQGLGAERENELPVLEPVLVYQVIPPENCDPIQTLGYLRLLEEEEPELNIVWSEESKEIQVQVMGEVQIEILKSMIRERFGLDVTFGAGSIVYKETIAEPVEGIGHFEPLRHYAEVHLLLEPGERGSGLQFASLCSEDMLDRNWQRLILTHLEERAHAGVLTGSEITDMRILLVAGRAHEKHTEGGDFRQATYRAVRHGLRRSKSILLEPVFSFILELPTEYIGRAMSDIQRMFGTFDPPVTEGDVSILTGSAPVAAMRDYQREVNAYAKGRGRLTCTLKGYEPCHNSEEVIAERQYDPDLDIANPCGSVFCSHGAGFYVDWHQVAQYAHVESRLRLPKLSDAEELGQNAHEEATACAIDMGQRQREKERHSGVSDYITQEEIEAIFAKTYGKNKEQEAQNRFRRYHKRYQEVHRSKQGTWEREFRPKVQEKREDYLLVDGYNIIFAWEELRALAADNIDSARDRLIDIMCNYQGYLGCTLILVFDAYKVKGNPGSVTQVYNIYVVYTREAETADQYIEKTVHKMANKANITVATSDRMEQMIIWGDGAIRMSAQGLKEAVDALHPQSFYDKMIDKPF